jgi:undecaprenyl-diphosphatase
MTFKTWLDGEKKDLTNGFYLYPKRNILFLLLGVFLLSWVLFRLWVVTDGKTAAAWDYFILNRIRQTQNLIFDKFFSFLTNFGSDVFVVVTFLVLIVFLFRKNRKRAAVTVFLTLVGSGLMVKFLKSLFGRPRPFGCDFGILGESCFSFPSYHSMASFYFYGMLFYLITRFVKLRKSVFLSLGLLFLVLNFLIGLSRIYLGFHFPSDVLAGYLLGGIWLLVGIILIDFLYNKTK